MLFHLLSWLNDLYDVPGLDRRTCAVQWTFSQVVEIAALLIDATGVLAIVVGLAWASVRFFRQVTRGLQAYRQLRQDIGRGILLGLELLVAGDIIRTVAVEPTLDGVVVLGLLVVIRTFLSLSMQVELEGRWPWQRAREP